MPRFIWPLPMLKNMPALRTNQVHAKFDNVKNLKIESISDKHLPELFFVFYFYNNESLCSTLKSY